MGVGSYDPIANALQALQAYNESQQPDTSGDLTPDGARAAMAPYLEHQSYDPTAPNFQPAPYGDTTIQMPDDATRGVGHLPPATPKSVPVMDDRQAAYRNGQRPAPDDVQGAQYQEDQSVAAEGDSALASSRAKQASDADTQNRLGDVYKKSYADQAAADQDFQTARQFAHQQADLETNQWLQDMHEQALKEPNPHRWFDNKSSFGKAMWALSLVSGAFSSGLSGGQLHNVALETAQKAIQDDMDEQKRRLDRELGALKAKGDVINQRNLRNLTDLGDDHTRALGRLNALQQEYLARAQAPGKAQNQAADAAVVAWIDQQKAAVASKRTDQAVRTHEEALGRAQAMRIATMTDKRDRDLASLTDKREREINAANNEVKLDLAKTEAGGAEAAAKAKADAEMRKDLRATSQNTGLYLVDSKGQAVGDGQVRAHKEDQAPEKLNTIATAANQRYADLQVIEKALGDDSFYELATKKDPALIGAVTRLGYTTARADDPSGRINDQDFANGVKQSLGYDPTSGAFNMVQVGRNRDAMLTYIAKEKKDLIPRVQNEVNKYNDADVNGKDSKILWTPKSVVAPDAAKPTALDSLETTGNYKYTPPADRAELEKRQAQEAAQPENAGKLVRYDTDRAAGVVASFEHRGPDEIKKLAATALDLWNGKKGGGQGLDPTTAMVIQQEAEKAEAKARDALADFETALRVETVRPSKALAHAMGKPSVDRAEADQIAKKRFDLFLTPDELDEALKAAGVTK